MEDGKKTMKINVLYEDNHVLVVEKPMNMLSQGDSTKDEDLLTLVKEYIKEKYHKPRNVYAGLVHRLDRPVGGIMVFAKTSKAASRLSQEIVDHKIRVQFASHHHPLCGDQRYGKEDKTQIALYAYQLEFIHPTTKKQMVFQLLPPKIDHWTEFTVSKYVQ